MDRIGCRPCAAGGLRPFHGDDRPRPGSVPSPVSDIGTCPAAGPGHGELVAKATTPVLIAAGALTGPDSRAGPASRHPLEVAGRTRWSGGWGLATRFHSSPLLAVPKGRSVPTGLWAPRGDPPSWVRPAPRHIASCAYVPTPLRVVLESA